MTTKKGKPFAELSRFEGPEAEESWLLRQSQQTFMKFEKINLVYANVETLRR